MLSSRSEKEEMLQIAESKKMKRALEDFLKELDPKALTPEGKIKSYEIQKDRLNYNPMDGCKTHADCRQIKHCFSDGQDFIIQNLV